jgi:hypothetical protein
MTDYAPLYQAIIDKMHACQHEHRNCETNRPGEAPVWVCNDCYNRQVLEWRTLRKQQLAAAREDLPRCERCGKKPMTWTYGPYQLCTACKKATEREHWAALAKHGANAGFAAMLATSPLVDTSSWARGA